MKRKWIVLISILLLTTTLACSVFSKEAKEPTTTTAAQDGDTAPPDKKEDTESPASQEDAADTPTPTTAANDNDDDPPINIDANALSGLDSYRLKMEWTLTEEDGNTENFTIEQEATRDPLAQRFMMADASGTDVEFIQVEETQWVRYGDEWVQTTVDEDEMEGFGEFFVNPDDMVGDIEDTEYEDLGSEKIDNLNTRHLRVPAETWAMAGAFNEAEIEKGTADLWVVDEPDLPQFVIRLEMEIEAKVEDKQGTIEMNWRVYDINDPSIVIEPPEAAEDIGLPGDVPLCPNASGLTTMGQMSMFTCEGTAADVNEFYSDQLTALSWEKTQGAEVEGMFTSSWTKAGETIQLTVMTEDNETNVMIVSQ